MTTEPVTGQTPTRLTHGHGDRPEPGCEPTTGCVMDFAVWRLTEGQVWADQHPCFNTAVTFAAQTVNDRLTDEGLVRLDRDFSARIDRARAARDPKVEERINRRLALWAARDCEHLTDDPRVKACNDTLERWLAGKATDDELTAAGAAAWATAGATAGAAARAAWAAARAAWAAAGAAAWAAAWAAARDAARDAAAAVTKDDALLAYLDRLLDAWEKIAADEGALGDLWEWADYRQEAGS